MSRIVRGPLPHLPAAESFPPPEVLDPAELMSRIEARISSRDGPALLPTVALQVHQLSLRPDVHAAEIVAVLERDATLAADVLKRASSAAFATRSPVRTLTEALVRLGSKNIQSLVWEVAVGYRVFRSRVYGSAMESLRSHSVATAHLSRLVASRTSIAEDYAFLCGLLHDVGIALGVAELEGLGASDPQFDLAHASDVLLRVHAPAGARAVMVWGLGPEVSIPIGAHHQLRWQGRVHPLAATVCVGEDLAHALGHSPRLPKEGDDYDRSPAVRVEEAYAVLGLGHLRDSLVSAGEEVLGRVLPGG